MNFDRLAPHYDWMEAVAGAGLLQRARTAWLEELRGCRHIVSVGEGHGRFAKACAERFPDAELTCVEASAGMLARARARTLGRAANLHWHHGDALAWHPQKPCDALVTCFFLDCFSNDQLERVIAHLAACASPQAVWLVTDFSMPASGPKRWRAHAVHALMYAFFRQAVKLPARRLTPPDRFLHAHGFSLAGRKEFNHGLLRADVWRRR